MSGPNGYSGDLYDDDMSDDVYGGNVQFDWRNSGRNHHSVYGDRYHFSWTDPFDRGQYGDDMDVHDSYGAGYGGYGGG